MHLRLDSHKKVQRMQPMAILKCIYSTVGKVNQNACDKRQRRGDDGACVDLNLDGSCQLNPPSTTTFTL